MFCWAVPVCVWGVWLSDTRMRWTLALGVMGKSATIMLPVGRGWEVVEAKVNGMVAPLASSAVCVVAGWLGTGGRMRPAMGMVGGVISGFAAGGVACG